MIRYLTLVFSVVLWAACGSQEPLPPNIILLMGDDHGWEETGYNGHPLLHTPVLDEMARQGLRLNRFYAAAPVCSPTRASVMTGRHPNRCGTFTPNWSIRPEEITIAQLLANQGYLCGHFGKWHLGPVKKASPTSPGAMGFHQWLSHDNFFELDPVLSRNGQRPEKFQGESSEILISEGVKFIEQAVAENRPYFLVIWFGSPHEPYAGLPDDLARYEAFPDSLSGLTTRLTSLRTGMATDRPRDSVLQERYAEITAMDRSIGELRRSLTQMGTRENTLLWYCGDNGTPASGVWVSPLRDRKGSLYEGGIRVPGIIEWPAVIKAPITSNLPSVTSDILPTVCNLLGIDPGIRPLDGISISPVIHGETMSRPPIFFWKYDTRQEMDLVSEPYIDSILQEGTTPLVKIMAGKYTRSFRNFRHPDIVPSNYQGEMAVIDGKYKLIAKNVGTTIEMELYDLNNDLAEEKNMVHDHPNLQAQYEKQLRVWQKSVLQSLTGADY